MPIHHQIAALSYLFHFLFFCYFFGYVLPFTSPGWAELSCSITVLTGNLTVYGHCLNQPNISWKRGMFAIMYGIFNLSFLFVANFMDYPFLKLYYSVYSFGLAAMAQLNTIRSAEYMGSEDAEAKLVIVTE